MDKLKLAARLLLGLIFFVFGLNGFFMFIQPPPPTPAAGAFITAMIQTGYFMAVVKSVEVICGAALLAGVYVPLALVVLAPIVINILLFHAFLDPAGLPMGVFCLVLLVYLAWQNRARYQGLFSR
ncbi:MAG: DoxX family membrane protein [Bdellovibrionaceae bacterium]|nr:DoxX family membrane protein [Bdellovibrionales bacterium]MCB9255172.1 DoxX family membrane protein [Pseudobdellovibrionaceae bacterium]